MDRAIRPLELRAEGRRLAGIALRYGDVSPSHRERFLAGSFDLRGGRTRWLDYRHDPSRILAHTGPGGGLALRDSGDALRVEADLPELPLADKALSEIRSGDLSGLSIEFRAERESRDNGIRVVEKADLRGIGLVASPSYPSSKVETRQGGTIRGVIPYDNTLACECIRRGTGSTCDVEFAPGSLLLPDEDLLAVWKAFGAPLGSTKNGSVRLIDDPGVGMRVEIDLPETSWAGDIIGSLRSEIPIKIRPMFDPRDIDSVEVEQPGGGKVDRLTRVPVRAILVAPTPHGKGWPDAEIESEPEGRSKRREMLAWL